MGRQTKTHCECGNDLREVGRATGINGDIICKPCYNAPKPSELGLGFDSVSQQSEDYWPRAGDAPVSQSTWNF